MSKEFENEEVVNEVEETKEGFLTKVKSGITNHKKTIVTVVAVIGSGVVGYLLGSKSGNIDSDISGNTMDEALDHIDDLIEE